MNRWAWIGIGGLLALAGLLAYLYKRKMSTFQWPVQGRLSSNFGIRTHPVTGAQGQFHNGIDIAAPIGTAVVAPQRGEVLSIYETGTGGKQLIIQHEEYRTGYAHLNRIFVQVGEEVMQGETIAEVGNTGASTGPHLHFTVTNSAGNKVDPLPLLA
jgi:murein DD-endopeptidase MepM/ murein hydrolase activator NlpD